MLEIKPPDYKFCPFCGKKLLLKKDKDEKKRKFCLSCNWIYYPHVFSAVAAVITKGRKVLMVRRRWEPFKDTWMFPAGFIDFGEHPLETLKREVREETGFGVKKAELMKILQSEDDPRAPGHFCFFYKVTASGNKIKTDEEENKEIAWVNIKNPPKIGWRNHRYILKLLQKRTC